MGELPVPGSPCSFISLPGTQGWNCTAGLQMPWGSCLPCSMTRQIWFHHSDNPAYERCAKTHAGYFVWFSQMPAPKITPKGGKTWPYGILQSRLLVGAGENGAHQSTLRVHCHLGNIRWKGETKPFTTCAAGSCGSPITSAGPALKTTGRPAPRLC